MAEQRRRGGQRLRSFTKIIIAARPSDDDADADLGTTGPTGKSSRTSLGVGEASGSSRSSPTKAKRKPTAVARSRLTLHNPTSSPFTPSNALLSTRSFLKAKSISPPFLADMQEQSPPPYTPLEFDPNFNDSSYYSQPQPTASSLPSIAYPATPPLPYSSAPSCSHSQCHVRRRNGTTSGSYPTTRFPSPTNSDSEPEDGAIYTSHRLPKENRAPNLHEGEDSSTSSGTSKRPTIVKSKWSWRHWLFALAAGVVGLGDGRDDDREEKVICTTPGGICAGETETETDEPSRHLPTARIIPPSESSPLPASTWQHLHQRLIPLLFEFSRLLSIVPAFFGTICHLYWLIWPPSGIDTISESGGWGGRRSPPERADFFVAALWSVLTGYQCLALTTGLLTRWQTYYPPLATLIRLLALQGICWPATQVTLTVLDHVKRPVVCWCVIGTTTCFSRSVQIWVTSNISVDLSGEEDAGGRDSNPIVGSISGHLANVPPGPDMSTPSAYTSTSIPHRLLTQRKPRFRWASTERHWDWKEVSLKCVLPAGLLYFVMAWVGEFRREWAAGC